MVPTRTTLGVLAVGILLCGCRPLGGVTVAFEQHRPEPGAKLAVLPFTNETPDMDIAPIARKGIAAGFTGFGYSVMDLDECDAKLRAGGITQGGQLAVAGPKTLGELVGADLILFGEVEEYRKVTTMLPGAITTGRRTDFASSFRMVHAPSGETLWIARGDAAGGLGQAYSWLRRDPLRSSGTAFGRPLAENSEIDYALKRALSTFTAENVVDEEELASRADPVVVMFGVAGGPSFTGDQRPFFGPCVSFGRGGLQLDVGLCVEVAPAAPGALPEELQIGVIEYDLGVRMAWRKDTTLHPYVSGGLSVARTNLEEGAGPEETVVMPYATGGIDWWLPWRFSLGVQLRLSTAAGGAGLAVNFATAF